MAKGLLINILTAAIASFNAESCGVVALKRHLAGVNIETYSIQFILYSPKSQITNLPQLALQSEHIRHPCPRTSHRIRNNSQEIEKQFSGKKGKKPSGEQQRRIPLQDGQKQ